MKHGLILLLILFFSMTLFARSPLTFEERVKAQEAIERVYYNHRIWPKENPQPKPPFEKMVTKEQIEAKVTDYLKKCSALDQFWQRSIIASQLQAEMDRMAKGTKDPATLNELFAALDNDPYLIAECLAKPVLADRLIHNWYASDERFHKEAREKAEEALKTLTPENFCSYPEGQYSKMTYRLEVEDREEMEEQGREHNAIGIDEMEFARMLAEISEEGKISGVIEKNDCFVITHTIEKNYGQIETESRSFQKTGLEEWLRSQELPAELEKTRAEILFLPPLPEGACVEGWDNGILDDPDSTTPSGRHSHTAVWTGAEMVIWGGCNDYVAFYTGGRYYPSSDSWLPTTFDGNYPFIRTYHTAVWTGTEMIIWGGDDDISHPHTGSGGKYNPSSDSWVPTSTGPLARDFHTAVWTGTEMIIWGGSTIYYNDESGEFYEYFFNTGGRYNPVSDSWLSTSGINCPSARSSHSAVWTGNSMIVWGGDSNDGYTWHVYNTGGLYNPSTNSWASTSTGVNVPSARYGHKAVWTGTNMIIWGCYLNTGGLYNPSTDSWAPTSTGTNVPSDRRGHTAVWTGTEMIIWGGSTTNTGGRYNPSTDSWQPTSTDTNVPSSRSGHTAVWTGNSMIVWGGSGSSAYLNTGGRYYLPYSPYNFSNSSSSDLGGCGDNGVLVEWSAPSNWGDGSSGSRTFDILRDGSPVATGLSESTLSYTDTTGDNGVSYLYQVRVNNGCGLSTTTTGMSAADNIGTTPDEVSNFDDVYSWDAVSGADGYRLYRGTLADLPNLMTLTADGCLRYEGTATSYDLSGDHPSEATGNLYWYLVTAYTGVCEGSAGEGTGFLRNLSSSTTCP